MGIIAIDRKVWENSHKPQAAILSSRNSSTSLSASFYFWPSPLLHSSQFSKHHVSGSMGGFGDLSSIFTSLFFISESSFPFAMASQMSRFSMQYVIGSTRASKRDRFRVLSGDQHPPSGSLGQFGSLYCLAERSVNQVPSSFPSHGQGSVTQIHFGGPEIGVAEMSWARRREI